MIVRELFSFMEGEWSFYTEVAHFNGRENGHLIELVTLMEGEWSCYRGGQFKGGRIVMLHYNGRENGG